jgi:hypothetical protein
MQQKFHKNVNKEKLLTKNDYNITEFFYIA